MTIRNQHDLNRANIEMAFRFAHTWTEKHFQRLCQVAVEQLLRDARDGRDERDSAA